MAHTGDTGASYEDGPRPRYTGGFSGVHYEAESCPDATTEDTVKGAAVGGFAGYGLGLLLRCAPGGRVLGAAAGAAAGALFSRYHLYLDWDPDRARDPLFGGESEPPSSSPDDPFDGRGPQAR